MPHIFNISIANRQLLSNIATFISRISRRDRENKQSQLLNEELCDRISKSIESWIESRGYTQRKITIIDLASMFATNRTYLSKYINTIYNCSFRCWVTKLRIDRSKELLMGSATIVDIALMTGFSSHALFTQTFKLHESMTPTQWRRCNKH